MLKGWLRRRRVAKMRRRAQRRAARGDHEGAVLRYRRALRLAPEDPITHIHLACALVETGQASAARITARRAVELADGEPAVHLFAGRVFYDLGDYGAARQVLEKAARLSPANDLIRAYRILTYWTSGNPSAWRRLAAQDLPDSTPFLVRWLAQLETVVRSRQEPQSVPTRPAPSFRPDRRRTVSFRPFSGASRPCA